VIENCARIFSGHCFKVRLVVFFKKIKSLLDTFFEKCSDGGRSTNEHKTVSTPYHRTACNDLQKFPYGIDQAELYEIMPIYPTAHYLIRIPSPHTE
jgi:hypothetical protein